MSLLEFPIFTRHVRYFRQIRSPSRGYVRSFQLQRSVQADMFLSKRHFVPRRASNLMYKGAVCFDSLQRKKDKIQVVVVKRARFYTPPGRPQHIRRFCVVFGTVSHRTCQRTGSIFVRPGRPRHTTYSLCFVSSAVFCANINKFPKSFDGRTDNTIDSCKSQFWCPVFLGI